MDGLIRWSRGLRWVGQGLLVLAGLAFLLGLKEICVSDYVTCRIILHLGSRLWLETLGAHSRWLASALLILWGVPVLVAIGAFTRFFRHLESGEPFRPGLSGPLRILAWVFVAGFGTAILVRIPEHPYRSIWLLRPCLFLLIATAFFVVARLADKACELRSEQDLVI